MRKTPAQKLGSALAKARWNKHDSDTRKQIMLEVRAGRQKKIEAQLAKTESVAGASKNS